MKRRNHALHVMGNGLKIKIISEQCAKARAILHAQKKPSLAEGLRNNLFSPPCGAVVEVVSAVSQAGGVCPEVGVEAPGGSCQLQGEAVGPLVGLSR